MPKPEIPFLLNYIIKTCEKSGYSWRIIDEHTQGLIEVSDGKRSFVVNSRYSMYPINAGFAVMLVENKIWTSMMLLKYGYKIPNGDFFYLNANCRELRDDGKELEDADKFADKLGYPVFVKPFDSYKGTNARVISSKDELGKHMNTISHMSNLALIQEYLQYPEYRFFIIDGKILFSYSKSSYHIHGNKYKNVPGNYLDTHSNLLHDWAKKLMKVVNLRVFAVDVFVPLTLEDVDSFIFIEINSNPGFRTLIEFGGDDKAVSMLRDVYKKYFESL